MEPHAIALLIDADNCPAGKIGVILDELAKHGSINIRRAYGDWKSQSLSGWAGILHDHAIQPVQQFAYTKGKNATDSAMIIDAMDLLYTQKLGAFCIASSDSDFTPLAMRIRTNGLKVFGFGEKKTPEAFVNACSKFLFLESLAGEAPCADTALGAAPPRKTSSELKGDTSLVRLLRNAVTAASDETGWAALATVGAHLSRSSSAFDSRNYGYTKLSALLAATGLFEFRQDNTHYYLRAKAATPKTGAGRP